MLGKLFPSATTSKREGDRVRVGKLSRARCIGPRPIATSGVDVFEGDDELGPRSPERGGDPRFWAGDGRPARAHRRMPALGELLAGPGLRGPAGPSSELYIDRGVEFGSGRRSSGWRETPRFLRVLEPSCSCSYDQGEGSGAEPRSRRRTIDTGPWASTGPGGDPCRASRVRCSRPTSSGR